jgi:hypothetical protein
MKLKKNMLHSKDINKIWELKSGCAHWWLEPEFILSSFKIFSHSWIRPHNAS